MDVAALEKLIASEGREHIPLVMLTVTNNSGGGQPVSMANIEAVREVAARHGDSLLSGRLPVRRKRLVHPAARAGLRANGRRSDIAQKMFSLADGCTFSAKKDAFANIGGMLCHQRRPAGGAGNQSADPDRRLSHLRRPGGARPGSHRGGPGGSARSGLSALPHRLDRLPGAAHRGPRRAHRGAARRPRHLYRRGAHAAAHSARSNFPARRWRWSCTGTPASARWRSAR